MVACSKPMVTECYLQSMLEFQKLVFKMENLHFLMSSGSADFAMISENMDGTVEFGKVFPNILMKDMIQYRMYRQPNVPFLVQNNLKNCLKHNTQPFFTMKKHTSNRYHPYLDELKKHRMNRNKFPKSDKHLESKMIKHKPYYEPKQFLEFLDDMNDNQDSVYKGPSPEIDHLSLAFGGLSVSDDKPSNQISVTTTVKERPGLSNISKVKMNKPSEEKSVTTAVKPPSGHSVVPTVKMNKPPEQKSVTTPVKEPAVKICES
eukprot:TCONS_00005802-protein